MIDASNEIGPRLEVAIDKMVYGGEGLARTAEGVVLVPGVLPGEHAVVEAEAAHHGVRRGRLLELTHASPERVPAECPYFGACGGCQHQQIPYERQLRLKQDILLECLERVGGLRAAALPLPICIVNSPPWEYRNRIRVRILKSAASFQVGYLQPSSHEICAVDACPISSPVLQQMLRALAHAGSGVFPQGSCEMELFVSDSDRQLLATVYSRELAPEKFADRWREMLPQCESICWRQEPSGADTVSGSGALTYRVGEFHYHVSHGSFFQVNRFLLPDLIEAAIGENSGERALDLYAGVGLLTLPLARRFERVLAIESHPSAARDLATNAGVMGTRVHTYQKTAENFLASASPKKWDMVIVDPPRAGLSKPVREHLARIRPPRLAYVSCDPTTLARDLGALTSSGYRLQSLSLLDQFPQTFHIETIAQLARA